MTTYCLNFLTVNNIEENLHLYHIYLFQMCYKQASSQPQLNVIHISKKISNEIKQ